MRILTVSFADITRNRSEKLTHEICSLKHRF